MNMNFFRYIVVVDSVLYKKEEPLIDSRKAGFFISGEEFDSKYLPFKKEDYYWLKFNRERDNKIIYVPFRDKDGIYYVKLIIDYSDNNFSIENRINLLNIQLNNSINIDELKHKFNASDNNPFYLNKDIEETNNNLIKLSLKNNNYIEINLNPDNDLSHNEINELKDMISHYFLKYQQN